MNSAKKLGGDRSITGLVPAIVTLITMAVVWLVFGKEAAFLWINLAFAVIAGFAFIAWLRTRSLGYLASLLYLLACTLMLCVDNGIIPGRQEVAPVFGLLLAVSVIFLLLMLVTKRTKWRGRDILELAARPVAGEPEAFTGRPYPVGQADFSTEELVDFAAFSRRNLIAMSYLEPERVVFVPIKMGSEYSYLFSRDYDYSQDTWVAFEHDGNVSVNISQSDYVAFTEDLDHDQLCRSLADVFLDFLDLHRKGQDSRVLDRLDAMKIGVFS